MPYIKQDERKYLDPFIDNLALAIQSVPGMVRGRNVKAEQPVLAMAGRINYVCTRLALKLIAPYRSYATIAMITGVFANIGTEFYRRYAVPYEQTKITENGDLDGYAPPKGTTGL